MVRPLLAIVSGFVVWSAVWMAAGRVMMSIAPGSVDPGTRATGSQGALLLLIAVSAVASLLAGWVTALLARDAAARAVPALAGVLLLVGLVVELNGWDRAPAWYHLVFLVLLVPATLAGARLRAAAKG